MAIATSEEIAAPATPSGRPMPHPKMRTGASTMFRITDHVCTTIPGLKFPVPRSAALMLTMPNWSDMAGMNHRR